MTTFFLTLVVLLILVTAMSVGVLMGRKPIAGSCGGMNNLGMKTECDLCGGKPEDCETVQKSRAQENNKLAYDAASPRP